MMEESILTGSGGENGFVEREEDDKPVSENIYEMFRGVF
jgi:hypothetical protein